MKRLLSACLCSLIIAVMFLVGCSKKKSTGNEYDSYEWYVSWIETVHNETANSSLGYFFVIKPNHYGCLRDEPGAAAIVLDSILYSLEPYDFDCSSDLGWTSQEVLLEFGRSYDYKIMMEHEVVASINMVTPDNPGFEIPESFNPEQDNILTWTLSNDSYQQYVALASHDYANNLHDYWATSVSPSARTIIVPSDALDYFGTNTEYELTITEENYVQNDEVLVHIGTYQRFTFPLLLNQRFSYNGASQRQSRE